MFKSAEDAVSFLRSNLNLNAENPEPKFEDFGPTRAREYAEAYAAWKANEASTTPETILHFFETAVSKGFNAGKKVFGKRGSKLPPEAGSRLRAPRGSVKAQTEAELAANKSGKFKLTGQTTPTGGWRGKSDNAKKFFENIGGSKKKAFTWNDLMGFVPGEVSDIVDEREDWVSKRITAMKKGGLLTDAD